MYRRKMEEEKERKTSGEEKGMLIKFLTDIYQASTLSTHNLGQGAYDAHEANVSMPGKKVGQSPCPGALKSSVVETLQSWPRRFIQPEYALSP